MLAHVIACILLADFLTGLLHWWEDTYGLPSWPLVGRLVIEPNIEHHLDPRLFVRMGTLVSRSYQLVLLAGGVMGLAWLSGYGSWQLVLVAALAASGNEIHAWSHGATRNRLVRLLQEMALVQTPQHHARHHRGDYSERFCTLTNWLNPLLDRLCFWRLLEHWILVAGVPPKRMSRARRWV
jgi:ubiquitin-conjugating enzyme E2 variant